MQIYRLRLTPLSAFGTPLMGDTLFGQLCWAIRNRQDDMELCRLLEGYTDNNPFMVVSNAFPQGFIPRPVLPGQWFRKIEGIDDRKVAKKRHWMPLDAVSAPLSEWLERCKSDQELLEKDAGDQQTQSSYVTEHAQPHNSINRLTGTTGTSSFAPYSMEQTWFSPQTHLECYFVFDETRLSVDLVRQCLTDIGETGFGRDASIGLGKFHINELNSTDLPAQENANACLTLAPCAPQGLGFDPQRSFYQLFTRFGKHGDIAVHQSGKPFKNPVLLAQAGAVFSTEPPKTRFIGQGLGEAGQLSKTIPETVQQGYAPVIPIHLPAQSEQNQ